MDINENDYIAVIYNIIILANGYAILNPIDYGIGIINEEGKFIDNDECNYNCYAVHDIKSYSPIGNFVCYDYECLIDNFNIGLIDDVPKKQKLHEAFESYYNSISENIIFVKFENDCITKIVIPKGNLDVLTNREVESNLNIEPIMETVDDDEDLLDSNNKDININKNVNNGIRRKFDYEDFERYLKSKIIGQDEALEKIATNIAMNYMTSDKKNMKKMLLVAPTGVGKTETFETIASYLDVPLTIYPTSLITQSGYVGKSIEDVLLTAYANSQNNLKLTENGIILFDEFDKIAKRGASVNDEGVQNLLLKFMDGQQYSIDTYGDKVNLRNNSFIIDSSMITVACAGAFSDIYQNRNKKNAMGFNVNSNLNNFKREPISKEELIEYGMIRELIGRFNSVVQYNYLSEEDLYKILITPTCSPLKKFQELIYNVFNVEIIASDGYIKKIASNAYKLNTGARSLQEKISDSTSCIERYLLMNNKVKSITITEDTISDPHKFLIKR